MALLPSFTPSKVEVRIDFKFFFDKPGVAAGISKKKKAGLYKAGSVVMQIARRSIKKMGMAKPKLAIMKQHPTLRLGELHNMKGVSKRTQQQIRDRLFEIRFRPPSQAGTPPNTHFGQLRNSITYAYDPGSESVVIGGFMQGINRIVSLHEFGGTQAMQAWSWIPDNNGRNYRGLIGWWAVGRKPQLRASRWEMMGPQWVRTFDYPARPYMEPAMKEGIKRGRIPAGFGSSVRAS
jgi:hypothetical protein